MGFLRDGMNDPLCLENSERLHLVFSENKIQKIKGHIVFECKEGEFKVSVLSIWDLWKRFWICLCHEFIGKKASQSRDSVLEFCKV